MDAFKRKLKIRIAWLLAAMLIIVISYLVILLWGNRMPSSIFHQNGKELATGAFVGMIAVILVYIFRTASCMSSKEKMQELYIRENDERRCLIMQKTGSLGFRISAVGLGLAAIVTGFFNPTVSLTLLGAIIFLLLVKMSLWTYYSRRY